MSRYSTCENLTAEPKFVVPFGRHRINRYGLAPIGYVGERQAGYLAELKVALTEEKQKSTLILPDEIFLRGRR